MRSPAARAVLAAVALGVAACAGGGAIRNAAPVGLPDAARRPAANVAMYDNLGGGKRVYDCCIAWTIGGGKSAIGKQWIAAPFTPASTRVVTKLVLALTWSVGQNDALRVEIAADAKGLPGAALAAVPVLGGLPPFNKCCVLQTLAVTRLLTLERGRQYWIVVRTQDATRKTVDNWQNNTTGAGGEVSGNNGKGWSNTKVTKGMPAFAVYGR